MRSFSLPFGRQAIKISAPDHGYLGTFLPSRSETPISGPELVERALDAPIGSAPLESLVKPGQRVVIVASDMTRPCPNDVLLPPVLKRLNQAGISDEAITVVIALGLHRPMSAAELKASVGEDVYRRVRVINHDVDNVAHLGCTKRGTPVEIFRPVVEADFRICLGNVEFHYFAGYSGGAKAIIPGTASAAAITANHSHMINRQAVAAHLEGNPVREDLEEGVSLLGVDFLLNVIVDEEHQVTAAAAGDIQLAHRHLCRELGRSGTVKVPRLLDAALVSAGGHPKDINLYQAQKALDNIAGVVRPEGKLVLFAECLEGMGSSEFGRWLASGRSVEQILQDIQAGFVLGGHKAAAIARVAKNLDVLLVTGEQLKGQQLSGMRVFTDPQPALAEVFAEAKTYAVFPLGASTLAVIDEKGETMR